MSQDNRISNDPRPRAWSWFFRIARQRQSFHIALAGTVGSALDRSKLRASNLADSSLCEPLGDEVVR